LPDPDPNIVVSRLSRNVTIDEVTVEVQIYRLENEQVWQLEVVNETGTSTVWNDTFDTEQDALDAFNYVIEQEGIEAFLDGDDAETLH
jgi:hypothetical protein